MKVICKHNKVTELKHEGRRKFLEKGFTLIKEEICIGKEYIVYAIRCINNDVYYFILEEEFDDRCPYPYEADFFEIIDNRPSTYWRVNVYPFKFDDSIVTLFAFPEWAEDPLFAEDLIDGAPQLEAIFQKYKILMDKEFI